MMQFVRLPVDSIPSVFSMTVTSSWLFFFLFLCLSQRIYGKKKKQLSFIPAPMCSCSSSSLSGTNWLPLSVCHASSIRISCSSLLSVLQDRCVNLTVVPSPPLSVIVLVFLSSHCVPCHKTELQTRPCQVTIYQMVERAGLSPSCGLCISFKQLLPSACWPALPLSVQK